MSNNIVPVPVGQEEVVYSGKIFTVVKQKMRIGEKEVYFEKARRAPGTRLLIVRGRQILMTKEYRAELGDYDYRLPGGKVFDTLTAYQEALSKDDFSLLDAAKEAASMEAFEEAGIVVKNIEHYHTAHSGATVEWDMYYFLVSEFEEGEQHLESGEDIEKFWLSFSEAKKICVEGKVREDRTLGVLLGFLLGLEN